MAGLGVWKRLGRRSHWLPALLLLVAGAIDCTTPPTVSASALYAAAVLVAAPLLSLCGTVFVGVCALVLDWAMFWYFGHRGSAMFSESAMVATVAGVAVFLNRLLYHREVKLQSVSGIATAVQRAVLPGPPARIGPLRFAARYEAAQTDAQIGGDLYAVLDTPYGVRCLIGYVCRQGDGRGQGGHGRCRDVPGGRPAEALPDRALGPAGAGPGPGGRAVGEPAPRRMVRHGRAGGIPPAGNEVRLLNRGHPATLLFLGDTVRYVEPGRPALPLGQGALSVDTARVDPIAFPQGAGLLLYTDGLTEARNASGAFYDPVGRFTGRRHSGPDALLDALLADVCRHTGGRRTDDMALLAITRAPDDAYPPSARRWRPESR
ncbi:PP2C family protein-serine/threonine phosphatase [Streptomyces sp. NPDC001635]